MHRILLVEDEENIRDLLAMNLEMEGYEVVTVSEGNLVMPTFEQQYFVSTAHRP